MIRRLLEAALIERRANRGDAAVHHVRGRNDVCARDRMRQGRLRQKTDGCIVDDLVALDDPAMAMRGVFAQAHISDHEEVAHLAFERAHRGLHRRIRIGCGRSRQVLRVGQAKENHCRHAFRLRRGRLFDRFIDRQLEDARHRADRLAHATSGRDEQRVDEAVWCQPRLADERTNGLGPAKPARPAGERELGGGADWHGCLERSGSSRTLRPTWSG
jgi:hypothetical protein